jgi:hypothetical protein
LCRSAITAHIDDYLSGKTNEEANFRSCLDLSWRRTKGTTNEFGPRFFTDPDFRVLQSMRIIFKTHLQAPIGLFRFAFPAHIDDYLSGKTNEEANFRVRLDLAWTKAHVERSFGNVAFILTY